jgi:predicted  nucleic acid-binding Zn-ribbon protein
MIFMQEQKVKIVEIEKELKSATMHIQTLNLLTNDKDAKIKILQEENQTLRQQVKNLKEERKISEADLNVSLPKIKQSDSVVNRNILSKSTEKKLSETEYPMQPVSPLDGSPTRMTKGSFYRQDKTKADAAADRLIHSVNAITDLLKTNTQLRDTLEKQNRALEDKEAEVFTLELENQNVRERLELVEGILKSNKTGYDSLLSANVRAQMAESSDHQATTASIDEVYQELIKLRSTNKKLEGRIKQLENQNFRITQSSFGSKAKISKNAEPIRPIFDAELAA